MSHFTEPLAIGKSYDRPGLARLWGLAGHQAFSRGVYTPAGQKVIFLFVTREKQDCLTQYRDFLQDDILFWEGERGHGSDERIIQASESGEQIQLFYRERHHSFFVYHGRVILLHCSQHVDRPSEFMFDVVALARRLPSFESMRVAEEPADQYVVASQTAMNNIDREVLTKNRGVAQRVFRGNLLRLWKGECAVTGVREERVLRSSHIKPWARSSPQEKVDHFNGLLLIPNLDALFNEGLISFRNDGRILISAGWKDEDKRRMHVTTDLRLRQIHPESRPYLEYHRDGPFATSSSTTASLVNDTHATQ